MSDNAAQVAALVESGAAPNADYAAQMLAKQGTSEPVVQGKEEASAVARPENIPEKFWDAQAGKVRVEDLLKSYGELEKQFSSKAPEAKPDEKPADKLTLERKPEEGAQPEPTEVAAALQKVGISFDDVNAEYQKTGDVSAETRAKLDAAFGKGMVDNYFAGLKALEATQLLTAHDAAGGKEVFDQATTWGVKELSDAELDSYNKLVSDPATQKQGIEWLVSKFRAANPSEGTFIQAEPNTGPGDVFNSPQEMTAAMRDPRYARDPAYREQIALKLARSTKAGTMSTGVSHHTQRL